jgi:hypothetical protein
VFILLDKQTQSRSIWQLSKVQKWPVDGGGGQVGQRSPVEVEGSCAWKCRKREKKAFVLIVRRRGGGGWPPARHNRATGWVEEGKKEGRTKKSLGKEDREGERRDEESGFGGFNEILRLGDRTDRSVQVLSRVSLGWDSTLTKGGT